MKIFIQKRFVSLNKNQNGAYIYFQPGELDFYIRNYSQWINKKKKNPVIEDQPKKRWQEWEVIGSGSFGTVYKGQDLTTSKMVAIKKVFVGSDLENHSDDV